MSVFTIVNRWLREIYEWVKESARIFVIRLLNDPDYADAAVTLVVCGVELLRPYPAALGPIQRLARTAAALVRVSIQTRHRDSDVDWQFA